MDHNTPTIAQHLARRGVSRRQFLKFCGMITATLALPASYTFRVARALAESPRPPLVWLEFQDCTGDTESFLRSHDPTMTDLIFDTISLDYHETLMVPAGKMAEKSLQDTIANYRGQYICVVEGAIPTKDGGVYCTIGERTALSIAQEVCPGAMINIAAGSCSWDGGLPAAKPDPTGAVGLQDAVPDAPQPAQHARLPGQRRQPRRSHCALSDLQSAPANRLATPPALRVRERNPR
jgi:hydrogenase small subunit